MPRPNAPPRGEWNVSAIQEEAVGRLYELHGKAEVEGANVLFRADNIEYNEETGDLRASGNVYFHNFERNEQIWADRVDYNTQSETGTFYNLHGETTTRISSRPGLLTTNNPFYFQGEWAERLEDRYVLHNGFVTNCKVPNPWWRLRGPKFDIIPGERAKAYRTTFLLKKMPIFYTPFFYHSLEREPRKSGILLPEFGNSSIGGPFLGVGYFWAINRSYDVTYRMTEYISRGEAHNVEFRGKVRPGTDFTGIVYAVHDRGIPGTKPVQEFSGMSVNFTGKSDLGNGWHAVGQVNYITSFNFRQYWSQSYNEAIGSELHSTGFLDKSWSNYTFDLVASRLENFQTGELNVVDPATGLPHLETNAVLIRKLPEAEFSGRERQIFKHVPVWFSFDSAAGLLYRSEPIFGQNNILVDRFQTGQFMNRINFAPRIMSAFHWGDFHLIPSFGIEETSYSESQTTPFQTNYQALGTDVVRSARDFSLDIIFPPLARVYSKKTIFGDKLKHVIEPRATYRYVSGIGTDFTQFIRFDETDLLSNTNELELSLTNRIYAKRGDTVQEIFTWQLWQKRFFDPAFGGALTPGQSNVVLSTAELTPYAFLLGPRTASPIVSVMDMSPVPNFSVDWRADYDPRFRRVVNSTFSLDYRWKKYFASVGDNLVHTDPILGAPANQMHFRGGFGDPNHKGWSAGFDGVYDYRATEDHTKALQYATTQVTYNTDCCGLSIQWRRFAFGIRDENLYRFSFTIANLGSFGTLRRQDRVF